MDSAGRCPPSEQQGGDGDGAGAPGCPPLALSPCPHVLARGSARPARHTASPGLLGTGRRDRGHRLFLVNCHRGRTAPHDGRGREDQPEMGQASWASMAAREGRGQRRGQRGGRAGPRNGPRLRLRGSSPVDPPVPSTPARVCVLLRAVRERGRFCNGHSRRDTFPPARDGNGRTRAPRRHEARVQGGRLSRLHPLPPDG